MLQFDQNSWSGESRRNGNLSVGDASGQHLYMHPDDPHNETKFTSAASEYFK
jgi:hypothetical protein